MNNILNYIKNNKFAALVWMGVFIQIICWQIAMYFSEQIEWFGNIGVLDYLFKWQLIGYIIQLIISKKITCKFTTSFKICGLTVLAVIAIHLITSDTQGILSWQLL